MAGSMRSSGYRSRHDTLDQSTIPSGRIAPTGGRIRPCVRASGWSAVSRRSASLHRTRAARHPRATPPSQLRRPGRRRIRSCSHRRLRLSARREASISPLRAQNACPGPTALGAVVPGTTACCQLVRLKGRLRRGADAERVTQRASTGYAHKGEHHRPPYGSPSYLDDGVSAPSPAASAAALMCRFLLINKERM